MSVPAPQHSPAAPLTVHLAASTSSPRATRPVVHAAAISRRLRDAATAVAPRADRVVELRLGLRAVLVSGPRRPASASVARDPVEALRRAAVLRSRHRRGGRPVSREFLEYVRVPEVEEERDV